MARPVADSMLRVAVGPCSPFSVTSDLMREAVQLARSAGVRLHTHPAETTDEEHYCREHFGCAPLNYVESLGWLGPDVWFAHGIHFDDDEVKHIGAVGTGVAHCPSSNARLGAGIARTVDLRAAGAAVGLGVDGAASNESSSLIEEVRHALLFARATGGPTAMTVRDALEIATIGGRPGSGPGRRDRLAGARQAGRPGSVAGRHPAPRRHRRSCCALVLGAPPPLELLLVDGRTVVEKGAVTTVDESAVAKACVAAHQALLRKTG